MTKAHLFGCAYTSAIRHGETQGSDRRSCNFSLFFAHGETYTSLRERGKESDAKRQAREESHLTLLWSSHSAAPRRDKKAAHARGASPAVERVYGLQTPAPLPVFDVPHVPTRENLERAARPCDVWWVRRASDDPSLRPTSPKRDPSPTYVTSLPNAPQSQSGQNLNTGTPPRNYPKSSA